VALYLLLTDNSELRNTVFIGGDGNFRLRRNNKGGGQVTDPSLFGDHAFYAPNEDYKAFNRARGGAPDDTSVSECTVQITARNNDPFP